MENQTNLDNPLYIFDYDDTLIKTDSKVRVYDKKTGETIQFIPPAVFIELYEKKDNEGYEYVDGDTHTTLPYLHILKDALSQFGPTKTWICTARYNAEPVKETMAKEGIPAIPVAAVGKKEKLGNTSFHASRKKQFIASLIRKMKPSIVFFYDDSIANLSAVGSLAKQFKIKVVLINTVSNHAETIQPD